MFPNSILNLIIMKFKLSIVDGAYCHCTACTTLKQKERQKRKSRVLSEHLEMLKLTFME